MQLTPTSQTWCERGINSNGATGGQLKTRLIMRSASKRMIAGARRALNAACFFKLVGVFTIVCKLVIAVLVWRPLAPDADTGRSFQSQSKPPEDWLAQAFAGQGRALRVEPRLHGSTAVAALAFGTAVVRIHEGGVITLSFMDSYCSQWSLLIIL